MSTVESKKSSKPATGNAAKKPALKVVPKAEDAPKVEGALDPLNSKSDPGVVHPMSYLLASRFEGGSMINAERASLITDNLDASVALLPESHAAIQTLEGASNLIARAELIARGAIMLEGGLYPDWAGNSNAWIHGWTRPFNAAMLENKMPKERRDKLGGAVRKWRTDNNLTVVYVAAYVLDNTPNLAKEKVKVNGKGAMVTLRNVVDRALAGEFDGTTGEGEERVSNNCTIPTILLKEIRKHYAAQKDGNGKTLDNFTKVPKKFGKGGNKGEGGRQTPREREIQNHNTYQSQLIQALNKSAKDAKGVSKAGELSSTFVAGELHTIVSAYVAGVFGNDGERLDDNKASRAEIVSALEAAYELLSSAIDYANEEGEWSTVQGNLAKTDK